MDKENSDRASLEEFVTENPDLERLEALLDQFNIFEALGAVRQEIRHSDFLAFLLNPRENHRLGDIFIKKLLQRAVRDQEGENSPITAIDLDVWDLDDTMILREWENIDILIEDMNHQFVVVIENKIGSIEHSNQLKRYKRIAKEHYPNWKILHLYLSPDGETPSDEEYIPIDYLTICNIVEDLIETRSSVLGPDVHTLMAHYSGILRRHIVAESEIHELCERIYHKHQRALDLLFEHRPDLQNALRIKLEELIQSTPGMVLDHCSKTYIRFIPERWDIPYLQVGEGWTRSGRLMLFEFVNTETRVSLKLLIGPGNQDHRQRIFDIAIKDKSIMRPSMKRIGARFCTIFSRTFISKKEYEDSSQEELEDKLQEGWERLITHDLPKIEKVLDFEKIE